MPDSGTGSAAKEALTGRYGIGRRILSVPDRRRFIAGIAAGFLVRAPGRMAGRVGERPREDRKRQAADFRGGMIENVVDPVDAAPRLDVLEDAGLAEPRREARDRGRPCGSGRVAARPMDDERQAPPTILGGTARAAAEETSRLPRRGERAGAGSSGRRLGSARRAPFAARRLPGAFGRTGPEAG